MGKKSYNCFQMLEKSFSGCLWAFKSKKWKGIRLFC